MRLPLDTEDPGVLRRAIRSVANDEEHFFSNGEALLAVLQEMVQNLEPEPREED